MIFYSQSYINRAIFYFKLVINDVSVLSMDNEYDNWDELRRNRLSHLQIFFRDDEELELNAIFGSEPLFNLMSTRAVKTIR